MVEFKPSTFIVVLKCVLLLLTISETVNAQQNCNNCVIISNCPALLAILQKPNKSPAETQALRNSQCGTQGRYPKVCCPATETKCTTPDQQMGTCKDVYQCQPLLELFSRPQPLAPNIKQFLRQSACQGAAKISVCCGPNSPTVPGESVPNTNINVDALLPKDCGTTGDQDRILGGNETNIDQYPWMALIEYRKKNNALALSCAGSLISEQYLVTAGHCVVGEVLNAVGTPVNVRLGEFDKTTDPDCVQVSGGGEDCNEKLVTIPIETIIPHPDYKPSTQSRERNDIALIRMQRKAPIGFFIAPVCLPAKDLTKNLNTGDIQEMVVAGWGNTIADRSSPSNRKLHLFVPFVKLSECIDLYAAKKLVTNIWDKQICAGGEAGKDSCRGDSGGPLVYNNPNNQKFDLIGVVSFGPTPCGLEKVPGVYTSVFKYISWIRGELKP